MTPARSTAPTVNSPLDDLPRRSGAGLREDLLAQIVAEQLRQETATFDARSVDSKAWGRLQRTMGWVALLLLVAVFALCAFMLLRASHYPATTTSLVAGTLLADVVALTVTVWRVVLGAGPEPLSPVTSVPSLK